MKTLLRFYSDLLHALAQGVELGLNVCYPPSPEELWADRLADTEAQEEVTEPAFFEGYGTESEWLGTDDDKELEDMIRGIVRDELQRQQIAKSFQ